MQRKPAKSNPAKPRRARSPRARPAAATGVAEPVYRTLFESSPVAILLQDATGRILDLNAAACQVFGYSRAELIGENVRRLVPPEDQPRVGENLTALLAGQALIHEVWCVRNDGKRCPLELHEQRINLPDGQPGILALAHDITLRKQAEATGNLRDAALKASANAIVVTDREGQIVWANPAFSRATGYALKEAIGQNPRLLKSGVQDAEFYRQLWDTILAGRVWQGELINRRRDGSLYHEHTTITPVRDAAGKITHFIAVKQDTTERNRLAEELRQSERFVRATLDALSAHIAILDERGVILDANEAWREFTRLNRAASGQLCEGAQYLTVYREISGADSRQAQHVAAGIHAVLHGQQEVFTFEFPCAWPGHPRWFVGRLTRCVGGGPAHLVAAHEDVSERKHAEEALTLSGHQYRVLTETMKDVVWILDADRLRFRYVSPSVRLLRGYTAEEVMAEPATNAFAPAQAEEVINLIRARADAFRHGQAPPEQFYVNEIEQPRKDGSLVQTEVVTSYHVNLETGHVEVRGTSRDITEREQARWALQVAEQRFRALFLASPLPIIVLDRDARVRLWSPAAEAMFGWKAAEVLGRTSPVLPEEQQAEMLQYLERVLAGETIRSGEPRQRQRKDGSLVDVLISAAPLQEPNNRVSGVVVLYTDLTEKARLEAQLLRAQRLESIGHLAGGIAHDLNNALTPILMAAPVLRPELRDPGSRSMLDHMEASALRGAQIVKQILVFARGGQVEKTAVQTRHLLRETAEAIRSTFPKNIHLKTDFPRDLWPVEGNITQLHQVVMNLCLNARDAMPEGGTLTLAAANLEVTPAFASQFPHGRPGPHIVWTISDEGHGIPAEDLGHIFDPFWSKKEPGKGTGLGLSIVYGIVRVHDGFLQVQSTPGRGTEFRIFLPATKTSPLEPEAEPPPIVPGQGELILVVDDEALIRQVLKQLLTQNGYQVALAEDGHQGLARVRELGTRLDAVLTDLMMPRMNGLQLIRALREAGSRPGIIAMTGLPDATALAELEQLGVHHLIQKPCDLTTLLTALRQALKARRPGKNG